MFARLDLCYSSLVSRTVLEASAYSASMSANLLLEKEEWKEAYEQFSTAKGVYEEVCTLENCSACFTNSYRYEAG